MILFSNPPLVFPNQGLEETRNLEPQVVFKAAARAPVSFRLWWYHTVTILQVCTDVPVEFTLTDLNFHYSSEQEAIKGGFQKPP